MSYFIITNILCCLILDQYNNDTFYFITCHRHIFCGNLELDLNFPGFDINWSLNCGDILISNDLGPYRRRGPYKTDCV